MPKKTARKKASSAAKSKKQKSFWGKFLTFPVIVIFAFSALVLITGLMVFKPNKSVLGVAATDYMLVSKSEQNEVINQLSAANQTPPTFHYINVFKDANKNGKRGTLESCLDKTVTLVINKKEKTVWACNDIAIYTKNRYATITLKAVTGYNFIGLNYKDSTTGSGNVTRLNGAHSVYVKGIATGYPQTYYYTAVDFGVHKK